MVPRTLFVGTPEFAVASLEALVRLSRESIVGVISQPDKPQGRHRRIEATPVKRAALGANLRLFQPPKIKSPQAQEIIEGLAPELIIVVAYGQILPKWLLDIPCFGALNVHASLLPQYRGAAPLQRAILSGERTTGISLMLMDEGMDTGPVISQSEFAIGGDETSGELAARVSDLAAKFLVSELPGYLAGEKASRAQDSSLATYAPPLRKDEGGIRFAVTASDLHNRVRALNPWPLAHCRCGDALLTVHRTRLFAGDNRPASPGELLGCDQDAMWVQCGAGQISLVQVQAPGKRAVSGRDFANGLRLRAGFRFSDG